MPRENRDIHPFVERLARCAAGPGSALRLWLLKTVSDVIAADEMAPDQVWTHASDATPSALGALVTVEIKKPGDLADARR